MKLAPLSAVAISLLILTGCSSPAPEASGPSTSKEAASPTTEAEPSEAPADATGTEENPWKMGEPVKDGDWTVTVNSWQPNVNDQVSAAGDDMSMLQPGFQYALLNATYEWNGSGTGKVEDVYLDYLPTGGNVVTSSWEAFGTTPGDNKLAFEELVSGGSVTGDMLYWVEEGNTEGVFSLLTPDTEETQFIAAQ